jgi:hypothetical protein
MTGQSALTIVAAIRPGAAEPLRALLERAGADPAGNELVPFGRLDGTHFARLLLLEEAADLDGQPIPAELLLMSDFDGPVGRYLERLVEAAGGGLDRLFGHCEGYPRGSPERRARLEFLRAHLAKADAVYVNTVGRTVGQIRREAQLREAIEGFLDCAERELAGRGPLAVRAAIRDFVAGQRSLGWARRPEPGPGLVFRLREKLNFAGVALGLLLVSPLVLFGLPAYLLALRIKELRDPAPHLKPDLEHVARLAALEDHVVQNQFSALGHVKPGPFRLFSARAVLFLTSFAARHVFNRANLAGVKTIHFARWVFLDRQRRLIFCSNYDGSLESYMDDFIDKVAWGLNLVFSNGVGYPRTSWLVRGGARDEEAFKAYLRYHQLPTQVWYSAYPDLTARNIANNARIRAGLPWSRPSVARARAWLARL